MEFRTKGAVCVGGVVSRGQATVSFPHTRAKVEELSATLLRQHLDVNAVQAFVPALAESRGSVVSAASISALMGQPYNAAYCASKAALLLGMRSLAVELAGRGIRVNCVSPGGIDTPMIEKAAHGLPADAEWTCSPRARA